jgi:hypothetical protein
LAHDPNRNDTKAVVMPVIVGQKMVVFVGVIVGTNWNCGTTIFGNNEEGMFVKGVAW